METETSEEKMIFKNASELEEFEAVLSYMHRIYKLSILVRFKKWGKSP